MILSLPCEVLLQVMDQLTPSDLSTLSQMAEFAHMFHHITDKVDSSREITYFNPHPSVRLSHLFVDDFNIDTSRYYLIEVTGAPSLVVAEDKTKHTRRVISMGNEIGNFTLDIKRILKMRDYKQKYVFTDFPVMMIRSLKIDPKMLEIYRSGNIAISDSSSVDDTLKLKMISVRNLFMAEFDEKVLSNVDFTTVPSSSLTILFTQGHCPMDLDVVATSTVRLYNYCHLKRCTLLNVERMELKPVGGSHVDAIFAPKLKTLDITIYNTCIPTVDLFDASSLEALSIHENISLDQEGDQTSPLANQNGTSTNNLFNNPKLWTSVKNLNLSVHSTRLFGYMHLALSLEELDLTYYCQQAASVTDTIEFPTVKRFKLDLGPDYGGEIPTFKVPALEELTIRSVTQQAAVNRVMDLETLYPHVKSLTLDHFDLASIKLILGTSVFWNLSTLRLLHIAIDDRFASDGLETNAQFPNVTTMELNCSISAANRLLFQLHTPGLSQLICKIERDPHADEDRDQFQNVNPWGVPQAGESVNLHIQDLVMLDTLIVSGATELYLKNTPSLEEIYHGGPVELEKLDMDSSVQHLRTLVYRNKYTTKPIQSVVCPCPGLVRRVVVGAHHPRARSFTY